MEPMAQNIGYREYVHYYCTGTIFQRRRNVYKTMVTPSVLNLNQYWNTECKGNFHFVELKPVRIFHCLALEAL